MRLSALCYSQQEDNRTRQINQKRRITETGQAFEPRSSSTLLERFSGFCGEMQQNVWYDYPTYHNNFFFDIIALR